MPNALDAAIAMHAEKAFEFLEALVAAPSLVGQEQAALEVFAREAGALGLNVARLPFATDAALEGDAGVAPPPDLLSDNRFQVLATTPGEGELHLLLNGHMDVVPPGLPELWTHPPFEPHREDGKLFGRGAADMKSGFAIGMLALRALRDLNPDLFARQRLGFIAVVEEECTGNGALSSIATHGVTAPEVVLLEPTELGLLIGGAGVIWVDVVVFAESGHAYAADRRVNAVVLAMRLVDGLQTWSEQLAESEPEPGIDANVNPYSVNLGKIAAGDWTSSAPASARLSLRLGFPRGWSAETAEAEVRKTIAAIADADNDFIAPPRVTLSGFRARGYLLDEALPLARDLAAAHEDAHAAPPRVYSLGTTTDARSYLNEFGIPAICYGAIGHRQHGIDEHVDLQSIVDAARTLARFLLMRFDTEEAGDT